MKCDNCGAGLTLDAYADCLDCPYCGTFHLPVLSLVSRRSSEDTETACPVCDVPLTLAEIESWVVRQCTRCGGMLTTGDTFWRILEYKRARRETFVSPPPLREHDLERAIDCPGCKTAMSAHPYYGPGNIVIDSCAECRYVWLDHGELSEAERAADDRRPWGG